MDSNFVGVLAHLTLGNLEIHRHKDVSAQDDMDSMYVNVDELDNDGQLSSWAHMLAFEEISGLAVIRTLLNKRWSSNQILLIFISVLKR